MNYESTFSFLEGKRGFDDIFKLCIQFEKSIVNQCYNSALMTGRVISEMLAIKLGLSDNNIRKNILVKKDSIWIIKREYNFETLIKRCYKSDENLMDYDIKETYFSIKNLGNSNAHSVKVSQYGISQCKEMHKYLFDIASDCFVKFFPIDYVPSYEYELDNINMDSKFTSDEVFNYLNNIHENEINTANFIDYIEEKKIFFTSEYFDEFIHPYRDDLLDKGNFESELKRYKWIDDSNVKIFLGYFNSSKRKELFSILKNKSDEILTEVINILNNQADYLTINDIDEMVKNIDEVNKLYFDHIKKLSDNFFHDFLNGIINELKRVLVKDQNDENKEIINKLKNYRTDFDDYGFTINQVEKNIFLDHDQKKAVEYKEKKPLIINAGPGSGKTRVITERVRYLVKECSVDPSSILLITFTNEATNELRNRLKYETVLSINDVNQMRISTIHGFCRYLIKKHGVLRNYLSRHGERSLFVSKYKQDLGFEGPYSIFGSDLPIVLSKYDHYFSFGIKTEEFAEYILNQGRITQEYLEFVSDFARKTKGKFPTFNQLNVAGLINSHYYAKYLRIIESFPEYERILEENESCDDNYLLKKGYEILCNYGTDYKNILIDEFQDTDFHLKKIIDKLKENSTSFTIVGDLDQSIYGFRGGNPEYFEEFLDNNEDNEQVVLHTNYSSTRDIVEFTEEFIKERRHDDKKYLKPIKQYSSPVYHLSNFEENDEFKNIIFIIKNLKKYNKIKYYSDVLVLFKSHDKITNFVKELELFEIPYFIANKNDFLEQNEIKAILTLYWYLLDYDKYNLQYNQKKYEGGNTFLCYYGFTNRIYDSSDFFKLSEETQEILNKIQDNYELNIVEEAKKLYYELNNTEREFEYIDVFNQDLSFVKNVVDTVGPKNLIELDEVGLVKLGIENKKDREFFLKLKNLKSQMDNKNYRDKPSTLKLFKEFITMTNFYNEISLKNSDDALKINKDISLISNIIKDYENIMGNKNYYGLFNYLNGVLKGYSSSSNELEEEMDKVHVRTIHNSKGLEYPVVIIGSLGRISKSRGYYSFPSILNNSLDEDKRFIDSGKYFKTPVRFLERPPKDFIKFHNDEEYRKIYVGATRAKEILILSTIGEVPGFITRIKRSNVNFEVMKPSDVINFKKIESSKIINKRNLVTELNVEKIINDYLFCAFRYNLFNNLKLELDIFDSNYVDMVAHNLLENIHSHHLDKGITKNEAYEKVDNYIQKHNVSSNEESLEIILNIKEYWRQNGSKYKILKNNIPVTFSLENCELNGNIDLIVQGSDENKISIIQFICTDKRMDEKYLEYYHMLYHFYPLCLKEYDEYNEKEIENIIVYSLKNNEIYNFDYEKTYEKMSIEFLESFTSEIVNAKFEKNTDSCDFCEYKSEFCRN